MPVRYDLGDYTCRIQVGIADTVSSVLDEISNFLSGKGWIRVNSSTAGSVRKDTFRSTKSGGGFKWFTLVTTGNETGLGTDVLGGITVHDDQFSNPIGYYEELSEGHKLKTWSSRFLIRTNVINDVYVFAHPKYAMFINKRNGAARPGTGIKSSKLADYKFMNIIGSLAGGVIGFKDPFSATTGTKGSIDEWSKDLNPPTTYNKADFSLGVPYYPGSTFYGYGTVSKLQMFGSGGSVIQTSGVLLQQAIPMTSVQRDGNSNLLTYYDVEGYGATGILEGDSAVCHVDTAKILLNADSSDDIVFREGKDLVETPFAPVGADKDQRRIQILNGSNGKLVGLYDDELAYTNLDLGFDTFKIEGKNIINELVVSSPEAPRIKFSALKVVQALDASNFMREVWLRVDNDFNLNATGQLRKFFMVPGGSRHFNNCLPWRWKWFNQNKSLSQLVSPHDTLYGAYYITNGGAMRNPAAAFPLTKAQASTSYQAYGVLEYWPQGLEKIQNSMFLLPA